MMPSTEYVKDWLTGIGRRDLARKADRAELPELLTPEADGKFAEWRRGAIHRDEFLGEIVGIDIGAAPASSVVSKPSDR